MKRMVSPCSSSYSSWPISSQSASLMRTKIPGRTVPSFRNNSGLSCRRLSDRNNGHERSGVREERGQTSHPVEQLLYLPDVSGGRFIRQRHFVLLLLKWNCWLRSASAGAEVTLLNNNSAPPPNSSVKFISGASITNRGGGITEKELIIIYRGFEILFFCSSLIKNAAQIQLVWFGRLNSKSE